MKRTYSTRYPIWTDAETLIVLEYYEQHGAPFCVEVLAASGYVRRPKGVAQYARKLGLRYRGTCYTRFQKGHKTWNKGIGWQAGGRSVHTRFQKGHIPHNGGAPVGEERLREDYWYVKTAQPNKWEPKHVVIWRQAHGQPPKGHCVVFRDGNPNNCTLQNLELISRAMLSTRNRWISQPSEYALLTDRPAKIALKKKGIRAKEIRQNPALLQLARIETFIKIKNRARHATLTER